MCRQTIVYSVEYFENKTHQNVFWTIYGCDWERNVTNSKPKNNWNSTWIQLWPEFAIFLSRFFPFHFNKWTVEMPACFSVQIMLCCFRASSLCIHTLYNLLISCVDDSHSRISWKHFGRQGFLRRATLRLKLSSFCWLLLLFFLPAIESQNLNNPGPTALLHPPSLPF